MSDSEDSEIDVCSIDEATAMNLHTGLTLVAAETYIPSNSEVPVQPVPLLQDDLLTKSKQKRILQAKRKECSTTLVKKNENKMPLDNTVLDKENHRTFNSIKETIIPPKISDPVVENTLIDKAVDFKTSQFSDAIQSPESVNNDNKQDIDSEEELFDTGVDNMLNKFHFESDHLAIKDNKDYHLLLKTLAVLEAQRAQAIKDVEELQLLKAKALEDPLQFVQNLQEKKLPPFPQRQSVAKIPEINWLHYMTAYSGDKYVPQITTRKSTKAQEQDDIIDFTEMETVEESSTDSFTFENAYKKKIDGSNPTFNQKWTVEEQEKLEKLLVMYPPEEVEARRWEKIAKALGNRTPMQVCSRIQKYFLKLAKAKLPIPGRMPSSSSIQQNKRVRMNLVNYKNSSFFPSWQPNVLMKEEDNEEEESLMNFSEMNNDLEDSDDETIPDLLKDSPEYRELMELKRMKKHLLKREKNVAKDPTVHTGFMCDGCNVDPIIGVRWHCNDCPQQQSIDFCNNCAQRSFTNETHLKDHRMIAVNNNTEALLLDNDYLSFEQRHKFKYNYLDPNFVPADNKTT